MPLNDFINRAPVMTRGDAFRQLGVRYINRAQYSAVADDGVEVITLWVENLDLAGRKGTAHVNKNALPRFSEGKVVKAVVMERHNGWRPDGQIVAACYPDDHFWRVDAIYGTELAISRILK